VKSVFCTAAKWIAILFVFAGYSSALLAQDVRMVTTEVAAALTARPEMPVAGAKGGDVTIVEFFDYNCPFCKKTEPELQKLLRTDTKVRILYKEWPVFGEVSAYAAQSALAANWQGKYLIAHNALIGAPNGLDDLPRVDSVLKSAGVDLGRLNDDRTRHAKEIEAILSRSVEEAGIVGFRGTPGFVIGRQIVPRSLTLPMLQQLIGNVRTAH
jgi:protein-disulfide isomerase